MEDNDEDGDEDGFEDALEAGEREEKEGKKESLAFVPDGDIAVSAQLSTYNSEETEEKSEVEITAEGHGPGEGSGEDDLVSAMQSTSISGSHISEMPTP